MSTKPNVLIADSDENNASLLQLMLEESFNLTFAENAEEVIQFSRDRDYDFAIIDYQLPDMDGITLVEQASETKSGLNCETVMLSYDNNERLVRRAYQAGVCDFIAKPYDIVTFRERILHFARDIEQAKQLRLRDEEIQSVAATAMKQAASYGSGLELIANLNKYDEIEDIGREILGALSLQGVSCAVQFRFGEDIYTYDADTTEINTVELQVFDLLKDNGRIYKFGKRTIFNDDNCSLLVKNMPETGTPSYDAIIDLGAKIMPAINSRFLGLQQYRTMVEAKHTLTTAIDMLSQGLEKIRQEKAASMDKIAMEITLSFHKLNLEESQEQFFMKLIEKELSSKSDDKQFEQLKTLITDCLAMLPDEKPKQAKPEQTDTFDVELF